MQLIKIFRITEKYNRLIMVGAKNGTKVDLATCGPKLRTTPVNIGLGKILTAN